MNVSINPAAVYAELDDGAVILNVDSGIYYGLDSVGSRIWALAKNGTSDDAIIDQLEAEYAVERSQLEADVPALLRDLAANGLVDLAGD